jgi:hypothetical protein
MCPSSGNGPSLGDARPLAEDERNVLAALFRAQFPGRSELAQQAQVALVRSLDTNGSLAFVQVGGPSAEVVRRIPVEAEAEDADGTTIHVLLHVLDGRLNELEIYREDAGPVTRMPAPDSLRLIVL